MKQYRVTKYGTNLNGAPTYYDSLRKAENQAWRWINSQKRQIGGGRPYAEIEEIDENYNIELINVIE